MLELPEQTQHNQYWLSQSFYVVGRWMVGKHKELPICGDRCAERNQEDQGFERWHGVRVLLSRRWQACKGTRMVTNLKCLMTSGSHWNCTLILDMLRAGVVSYSSVTPKATGLWLRERL